MMVAVPFNKQSDITDVAVWQDTAHIDIWYPRNDDTAVKFLEVGLMDVRASDGIRVHYDFERDGFVVCQPKPIVSGIKDSCIECGEEWIEVGFFQSWKFNDWNNGFPSAEEIEAFKARELVKAAKPS